MWNCFEHTNNKVRGVTISLRTGGQGHLTPIHTPNPTPYTNIEKVSKTLIFPLFDSITSTDQPTDGRTKPLIELRVRN